MRKPNLSVSLRTSAADVRPFHMLAYENGRRIRAGAKGSDASLRDYQQAAPPVSNLRLRVECRSPRTQLLFGCFQHDEKANGIVDCFHELRSFLFVLSSVGYVTSISNQYIPYTNNMHSIEYSTSIMYVMAIQVRTSSHPY